MIVLHSKYNNNIGINIGQPKTVITNKFSSSKLSFTLVNIPVKTDPMTKYPMIINIIQIQYILIKI